MKVNEIFVRIADVSPVHDLLDFFELLGRVVLRLGAGNEEFDGDIERRGDPDGFIGTREVFISFQ